ncbi:MAG: hypothetical protein Q9171_000448 [Xanthocarpia ochracea]
MALRQASSEANAHLLDDLIGAGPRSWRGVYRDAQPVEMLLVAQEGMTWKMLAEGITGAQMVVFGGKECHFAIIVPGAAKALGYGQIKRTNSASGGNAVVGTSRGSNATLPSDLAEGLVRARANALPDPYAFHEVGKLTTWEFFGYHGVLNVHACTRAWVAMYSDVLTAKNSGHIEAPVGTRTMHWPERVGDDWVDLVVVPREKMTWRMLGEGVPGGIRLCAIVAKECQFGIIAEDIEGEVGVGSVTARNGNAVIM